MKFSVKIIIAACLFAILGLTFNLFVKDYILDKKGIKTIATVTKFDVKKIGNGNKGGFSSLMQYEFEVNGSIYVGNKSIEIKDLNFPSGNSKIGTKIQIVYLTILPEINKMLYTNL